MECATAGIYLAGACQGPKDIPDTVSQASAAAAKVMTLFAKDKLEREPIRARVKETGCVGCFACKRFRLTAPSRKKRFAIGRGI